MSSYSRRPPDQRSDRYEDRQRRNTIADGLLGRYTSRHKAADGRETTRLADHDRTRSSARPRPRPQRPGMLLLRQGGESGRAFEVHQGHITIGRSRESDIVLEDEAVSRVHAVVTCDEDGRYRIHDQNSANGTYVNGERITEYVIEDGDEIQVGLMVLEFRQSEPE
jgi:hypothetical protein